MQQRNRRTAAITAGLAAGVVGLCAGSAQAADITPIPIPGSYLSITPIPIPGSYLSITPIPIPYVALPPRFRVGPGGGIGPVSG